ncbi:MAG: DUF3883 domain-containing protein [Gammaproteobacteria bacterium]|nr:DUF3883 domain-containing protein [Pseudomonadales bacterium]
MSLLQYESAFARLNPNKSRGNVSPHKIAMLLAVMDLIESGVITENRIPYNAELTTAFTRHFDQLKGPQDRDNPHLPFFHLRSESFWHHQVRPGQTDQYEALTTASGPGIIQQTIALAYLDDELFELLGNYVVRELLKTALHKNLDITTETRQQLLEVDGWDWLECEACVADYFAMLFKELNGETYNKTEHRRALAAKLNNRSSGSVEFKHQNISAVLVEMGYPYIAGYKPRYNYQQQLKEVVLAYLAAHQNAIDAISATNEVQDTTQTPYVTNWDTVFDPVLPERLAAAAKSNRRFLARKPNYVEREARNRRLGEAGERFVLEFEKYRLAKLGRSDLAKEVAWSSKDEGDGLGYDIRSFQVEGDIVRDEEHFIEVKTTNSGKELPFLITDNELAFSREQATRYSLYRVYRFGEKARLFQLRGAIDDFVTLQPTLYRAAFTSQNTH